MGKAVIARASFRSRVWPAMLAARFAQEIGLPPGNLWEPGIAAHIAEMRVTHPEAEVETAFRLRLGLADGR